MKSAKRISRLLLVVIASCGASVAQSDQSAPEIRQEGSHKILVRIGGGDSHQPTAAQRPVKQITQQERQLLEQQKSAAGPRLPDATAVGNPDNNSSTFDSRPILTLKPGPQETA